MFFVILFFYCSAGLITHNSFSSYKQLQQYETKLAFFYYGRTHSPSHSFFLNFLKEIPSLHIPVYHIPSETIQLPMSDPNFFLFYHMQNGHSLSYPYRFSQSSPSQLLQWVSSQTLDHLPQLTQYHLDSYTQGSEPTFIVMDHFHHNTTLAKQLLGRFCTKHNIKCGKISDHSPHLDYMLEKIKVHHERKAPRLTYYNPTKQRLQLYKLPLHLLQEKHLYQLYSRGTAHTLPNHLHQ